MRASQSLAVIAAFTALAISSDFALVGIPNVKLVDTLVFMSAYLFGFRVGASVGILSELIWAYASPWGAPSFIAPFLILGEVLYAGAGFAAARIWSPSSLIKPGWNLAFGGLLAISAFLWDLETNFATAVIAYWPALTTPRVVATMLLGIPFMLFHEVSDFAFGLVSVPVIALLTPRLAGQGFAPRPNHAEEEE